MYICVHDETWVATGAVCNKNIKADKLHKFIFLSALTLRNVIRLICICHRVIKPHINGVHFNDGMNKTHAIERYWVMRLE